MWEMNRAVQIISETIDCVVLSSLTKGGPRWGNSNLAESLSAEVRISF